MQSAGKLSPDSRASVSKAAGWKVATDAQLSKCEELLAAGGFWRDILPALGMHWAQVSRRLESEAWHDRIEAAGKVGRKVRQDQLEAELQERALGKLGRHRRRVTTAPDGSVTVEETDEREPGALKVALAAGDPARYNPYHRDGASVIVDNRSVVLQPGQARELLAELAKRAKGRTLKPPSESLSAEQRLAADESRRRASG